MIKKLLVRIEREVILQNWRRWQLRRFIIAIPFYFAMLGKLTWMNSENNLLRGKIMDMERKMSIIREHQSLVKRVEELDNSWHELFNNYVDKVNKDAGYPQR